TALATSVLLHPQDASVDRDIYGWIPLIGGLAMSRAVRQLVPDRQVSLKWPNDVLIEGKKVCGLLCELLPDGSVVVGAGVNLTIPDNALPVPHATSLMLMGVPGSAEDLADVVLAKYLQELAGLWSALASAAPDEGLRDIRSAVTAACSTLGKPIRLSLPDGTENYGTALDLDDTGRLCVRRDADGSVQAVAAGDVTHLRYE
ncbi:MAG: biotin--[acetyl-CoA-carboxylase] ligase, partial [Microbacteriaceae bacterium]|nr:biotin--[acetyl-CoA-carboxylase] ligase [Microbacteriaceae bacterium]